jgi:hypothetical protein
MTEHAYRVYEIGEDGHVRSRRDLAVCINDDIARAWAKQLVEGHPLELWDGACLLARFEPKEGKSSGP